MVTARLFLAPLVAGLGGRDPRSALAWRSEALACGMEAGGEWETFVLGATGSAGVQPAAVRDSSSQRALGRADVLIRRRGGACEAHAGDLVETLAI
jgi:molybdopterin molybdotransferase